MKLIEVTPINQDLISERKQKRAQKLVLKYRLNINSGFTQINKL